jgi:hypothetical protein
MLQGGGCHGFPYHIGSSSGTFTSCRSPFQVQRPAIVESYCYFSEVFDQESLPRVNDQYISYQLIRNVLATHHLGLSFCVLLDERRPDLIEAWFTVMSCVKIADLRTRCKVLTWQELAEVLPKKLQHFLEQKYGIVPPARTPRPVGRIRA